MAGSAVVASLSFLTAALLLPTSSGWILPKQLRNVLFASSVCYTFIPVWTLIKSEFSLVQVRFSLGVHLQH